MRHEAVPAAPTATLTILSPLGVLPGVFSAKHVIDFLFLHGDCLRYLGQIREGSTSDVPAAPVSGDMVPPLVLLTAEKRLEEFEALVARSAKMVAL